MIKSHAVQVSRGLSSFKPRAPNSEPEVIVSSARFFKHFSTDVCLTARHTSPEQSVHGMISAFHTLYLKDLHNEPVDPNRLVASRIDPAKANRTLLLS